MVPTCKTLDRDVRLAQNAHGNTTTAARAPRRRSKRKKGFTKDQSVGYLHETMDLAEYEHIPAGVLHADLYRNAAGAYLNGGTGRPFATAQSAYDTTNGRRRAVGAGTVAEIIVGYAAETAGLGIELLKQGGDIACNDTVVEVKAAWQDHKRRKGHQVVIRNKQFAESDLFVLAMMHSRVDGELDVAWYVVPSKSLEEYVAARHHQPANPDRHTVTFGTEARRLLQSYRVNSFLELADRIADFVNADSDAND